MSGLDLEPRWRVMWQALGAKAPPDGWFSRLLHCWNEPHRRYHTLEHLCECLGHLDKLRDLAAEPAMIELALWFHDAVYEPGDDNNELNSAYLAERAMAAAGLSREAAGTMRRMILATRHNGRPETPDEALLVDIDLAILGSPEKRYDRFEDDIRAEYHAVPWAQYVAGRRRVLKGFQDRYWIYHTDWFRSALDEPARLNLKRALKRLPVLRAPSV
jgi:predicted metal-dependent HD superfamily phosphohydrolase